MEFPIHVQGRILQAADISWIRSLMTANPDWNRSKLSRHIARHWQWYNPAGQLKDIAARTMLRKLEDRGFIKLPPRQRAAPHSRRSKRKITPIIHATTPIEPPLRELQPITLEPVADTASRELFTYLLHAYHYLSYSRPVGENIAFIIRDRTDRPLGCLLFGAAAWKCAGTRQVHWLGRSNPRSTPPPVS